MSEKQELAKKARYDIDDLLEIMRFLRAPDGCPWDREQTHESIRSDLIEETYETAEAIDKNDPEMLCEELGDILLQVIFHSQLSAEEGSFSFADVVDGICKKMVLRHPHVFGDVHVDGTEDVLTNWDAIKQRSHGRKTVREALEGVSPALPSLMRAAKLAKKANKAGIEFEDSFEQIPDDALSETVGETLFSLAASAAVRGCDPETALERACDAFIRKFDEKNING